MRKNIFIILFLIAIILTACAPKHDTLILATTTSTYDSGLLDYLLPDFLEKTGILAEVIPAGTGQAIKMGERGDVDVILVHAPQAELEFVEQGFGIKRQCVMYNDFIVLGPEDDPLEIKGKELGDALKAFREGSSEFISRGDDSGTHKKEISLWKTNNVTPSPAWHLETGSGMGDTLRIANEKKAYTLSDRGTYLSLKDKIDLIPLVQGDEVLLNPYGVIIVDKDTANKESADKFVDWLMSEETQNKIDSFEKNGEKLFHALRGKCLEGD